MDRPLTQQESGMVPGDISGGANTSHTITVQALASLMKAVSADALLGEYERAVVQDNVLGKETVEGRRRAFRYLRELYVLRPDAVLFRALRDLWQDDLEAQPLLAALCALARDTVFRASSPAILRSSPGDVIVSRDLADSVRLVFPSTYSEHTLAKIGRNTFSSWSQSGHLEQARRARKQRQRATCRPANVAYALLLGHLQGIRGNALFETLWAKVLDHPQSHLLDLAFVASQQGMLELRQSGGLIDVGFRELLRPQCGERG